MTVGSIGGGASGMAAALAAAENPNAEIFLFERQARLGQKLSATGNGRCNLSNLHALEGGYHGQNVRFADFALQNFGPDQTLEWFRGMGLFTVAEASGRVYPYSDQANSVVDILRFALEKENIHVITGFEVTKVQKTAAWQLARTPFSEGQPLQSDFIWTRVGRSRVHLWPKPRRSL